MAINRATYYQAPPPDINYKDTPAYQYASIFLKARADQFKMSLEQAASEISNKEAQNKLLVDAYKKKQSDLQDSLDNINKLIAQVNQGNTRAFNATEQHTADEQLKRDAQAQAWAKAKGELTNVPFSKSSGFSVSSGGGEGSIGGKLPSGAAADVEKFELANRGKDLSNLMTSLAKETSSGGIIAKGTDVEQTNIRGQIASRAANVRAAELQLQGVNEAEAIGQAQAEAIAALNRTDPVAANQVKKYFESAPATPAKPGEGGSAGYSERQSVSGAVQRPKYDLAGAPPQYEGDVERNTYITDPAALEAEKKNIEKQLGELKPPEMSNIDFITRAREIMAGRFGPVMPAPNFYQRNVVQGLQGATDEQIRQAYDLWKKSRPAAPPTEPAPPVTPAPPVEAAPTATPTTAGAPPVTPAAPPVASTTSPVASPPVTPSAPAAPPAPFAPAADAAQTVNDVEAARRKAKYPIRQKELDALFPDGGLPENVLQGIENIGKRPAKPEQETPGIGAKTFIPTSSWMPTTQPGGTVSWESKGPKIEEQPRVPNLYTYLSNRTKEALPLSKDPKALESATKSGPGKVAADIYRANAATGQSLQKTLETITMTFAGDPESTSTAYVTAIALDMAATNKTAIPKE